MTQNDKKKIGGRIAVIILIIIAAALLFGGHFGFGSGDAEHIGITTEAATDSITIGWKQQDDVQYYEVYRIDFGQDGVDGYPAFEEYENIAYVNGDKKSYKDADVETGHTYGYVVAGYRKSFGHVKQVCTSYIADDVTYEVAGPVKPGLFNDGYGENHTNSKDKLYLYLENYGGTDFDGLELYRKSEGDEYEKIRLHFLKNSKNEILDKTVTPGETYTYKVRAYTKRGDKKVYAADSDEVTIPAVNFEGKYDVEVVGSTEDAFAIKVTSAAYNGLTVFDTSMPAKYTVQKKSKGKKYVFGATLVGYSKGSAANAMGLAGDTIGIEDDAAWLDIPEKGVRLKEKKSVYLKYTLSKWEGTDEEADTDAEVFFDGSDAAQSSLFMDGDEGGGAEYHGSGLGQTIMKLDLIEGEGSAYCDWDY